MEFRLPQNLQVELLSYDPTLKALARQAKRTTTKTKSKYPFGNPNDIIPNDVIRQSSLDHAITNINANPVISRFQLFKKLVADGNDGACKSIAHAILYHYEQCWYAAWLPPAGKENEYVYGYAIAYKDTAAAWKSIPHSVKNNRDNYTQVTYGRSVFYTYTKCVTKEDICNGMDQRNWSLAGVASYYDKCRDLAPAIKAFEESLKQTVPTWEDSRGIFDRIKTNQISNSVLDHHDLHPTYLESIDKKNWTPSYETVFKLIQHHAHQTDYRGQSYRTYACIIHIISKPFFKKWIQSQCEQAIAMHADTTNNYLKKVKQPWNTIFALFDRIQYIHKIWPDCPIDYYQNHIDELLGVRSITSHSMCPVTTEWLNKNMPVASFFKIIAKYYEENIHQKAKASYNYQDDIGRYGYYFHEWSDTMSMLSNIFHKDIQLAPPKRWRIEEFHDYVQAEPGKLKHENEALPQDLFPTPIKVDGWSFFQPIDTHQLAQWGQAVRNCVGNANHYAEGVRKKKHFIVLCMVEGKPQFTVQLEVNNGLMSVKQIAGISNARLTDDDRELYTTAFAKALHLREDQLKS